MKTPYLGSHTQCKDTHVYPCALPSPSKLFIRPFPVYTIPGQLISNNACIDNTLCHGDGRVEEIDTGLCVDTIQTGHASSDEGISLRGGSVYNNGELDRRQDVAERRAQVRRGEDVAERVRVSVAGGDAKGSTDVVHRLDIVLGSECEDEGFPGGDGGRGREARDYCTCGKRECEEGEERCGELHFEGSGEVIRYIC